MRTFAGYPIQLFWQDLKILETAVTQCKPDLIIELGTGTGASALFFSLHAPVATFDNKDIRIEELKNISQVTFYTVDVFSKQGIFLIDRLMKTYKLIFLFSDNGDKPKEFLTFAPMLKPGDYIAVHDVGLEISLQDIDTTKKPYNLEPVFENLSISELSTIRVFKKENKNGRKNFREFNIV